jgi:hypothetical protein
MTKGHWFWWSITLACVVWYSTITVHVAIRAAWDIRKMLDDLGRTRDGDPPQRP